MNFAFLCFPSLTILHCSIVKVHGESNVTKLLVCIINRSAKLNCNDTNLSPDIVSRSLIVISLCGKWNTYFKWLLKLFIWFMWPLFSLIVKKVSFCKRENVFEFVFIWNKCNSIDNNLKKKKTMLKIYFFRDDRAWFWWLSPFVQKNLG